MTEVTEKYYQAEDGRRFKDKEECAEYDAALKELDALKAQRLAIDNKIAHAEYVLHTKGNFISPVKSIGGCGHDGYYYKCPHCEAIVGGYEMKNTSLRVDDYIYKCEKCGGFFRYR